MGGGGQGSSPGMMAVSRTASYTFTVDERFKDAQYTGGWLAGRVHGRLESSFYFLFLSVCMNLYDFSHCGLSVSWIMLVSGCGHKMYS